MKAEDVKIGMEVVINTLTSIFKKGERVKIESMSKIKGYFKASKDSDSIIIHCDKFEPYYNFESCDKEPDNPSELEIIQQQLDTLQKEIIRFRDDLRSNTSELIKNGLATRRIEEFLSHVKITSMKG